MKGEKRKGEGERKVNRKEPRAVKPDRGGHGSFNWKVSQFSPFDFRLPPFSRRYCAVPRTMSPGSSRAARRAGMMLAAITMMAAVNTAST